jgi:hypothetical protein
MSKGDFRRIPHYQPVAFSESLRRVEDLHVFPVKLSVIFFLQSMRRADARGPAEAQWTDPLLINLLSTYMQILFKILPSISMQ